ncbi:hypothetical protein PINS_up009509 [Pythium insidiosum]|nr:hypothetical protein PINS_up009509 [Pythium insidiosum]
MVHGPEFGSELVINPDCFPDVKVPFASIACDAGTNNTLMPLSLCAPGERLA